MLFEQAKSRLENIIQNIASNQGIVPLDNLIKIEAEINQNKEQYVAGELQTLADMITSIRNRLIAYEQQAQNKSRDLANAHKDMIDRIYDSNREYLMNQSDYQAWAVYASLFAEMNQSNSNNNQTQRFGSVFEHSTTAEQLAWASLRKKIINLSWHDAFGNRAVHNSLTALISLNDTDFLAALALNNKDGNLVIGEEIGHLVVQRLKDIIANENKRMMHDAESKLTLKEEDKFSPGNLRNAHSILKILVNPRSQELFAYDCSALNIEITKLALHGLLNPKKKKIWIGTARAVEAMIKKHPGDGMYLNSLDKTWSWELNRAWLQAAVAMKYEIVLVEQHFPNIEKAILSGDPANFILALASEARLVPAERDEEVFHSQYNGGESPTATPQEILILMEMGCRAKKHSDGRISFVPPSTRDDSVFKSFSSACSNPIRRIHSCPDLNRASPPPPLDKHSEHVKSPPSSPDIRTNMNK